MPLQLRSHCRRGPLGAAAFLQLSGAGCCAWCCGERGGMPAVVASLAPWRVWRCGMLGAVVHLVAVTHLAQRRTWHSGVLSAVVRMEKLGNSHQLPQIGPPFVYLGLSYTALNLFHAGLAR